jgi:hypothetical protein
MLLSPLGSVFDNEDVSFEGTLALLFQDAGFTSTAITSSGRHLLQSGATSGATGPMGRMPSNSTASPTTPFPVRWPPPPSPPPPSPPHTASCINAAGGPGPCAPGKNAGSGSSSLPIG